ncbi:hypothetical protein [Microvirga tunisiensis]|uniref:Uncharacterized protein n=1 Tax=Microvirga tunisiensis TaxID=2108360 RepID=A0A5N7MVB0_9HYPH|nr:hypothetical protein [Microvirga tunisiensis]MPR12948.1 hypothetical protein [Microvirga tunisiensis]MPR30881.1 hypothetical protein [Microvirga tunisiensis]
MSMKKIARNKHGDDLLKVFGPLANRIVSDHWEVYAHQSQYERLVRGEKTDSSLRTYSILKPSIFDGFQKAIVASACMTDTMFFRLYTARGIDLQPVKGKLCRDLRYDQHEHGERITIYYAATEAWSKTYRDKIVEDEQGVTTKFIDKIKQAIVILFGAEPFLWMGNKDLPDSFFPQAGATRLPNTPHGLNSFQGYHNVAVISALNPPPVHFSFMESCKISGEELRTAHYRSAVYQAVMRCSIRKPGDENPKRVVVMDRDTAEWLANLFPGAKVQPLDGMGIAPSKGTAGRTRQYESNAEKNRAYNERQEREWLAQLDAINGTSFIGGRYRLLVQEVRDQMKEFARDEIPLKEGNIVTPSLTSGTAFASIYDTIPLGHVDYTDDESFISALRDLHGRQLAAKEDAGLFSPAHFEADKATDTSRGLDNITHVRGIWLDNDGGDLTPEAFADLFPSLRMVIWNTYSSTLDKPRWRVFIPTTYAMSLDVYGLMIGQIVKVLNDEGYWGKRQLEKNHRIKRRRCHGFDESKFTPASLFYLPCQAKDPAHSFFDDYNDLKRGPLDLCQWIEHCILDLRPDPEPEPATTPAAPKAPTITETSISTKFQDLRDKLLADQAKSRAGQQAAMIEKAIDEWRTAPRGDGNNAFFRLGAALQRAGLDEIEIRERLREEVAYAHSKSERRKEIPGIIKSLRRRGTIR